MKKPFNHQEEDKKFDLLFKSFGFRLLLIFFIVVYLLSVFAVDHLADIAMLKIREFLTIRNDTVTGLGSFWLLRVKFSFFYEFVIGFLFFGFSVPFLIKNHHQFFDPYIAVVDHDKKVSPVLFLLALFRLFGTSLVLFCFFAIAQGVFWLIPIYAAGIYHENFLHLQHDLVNTCEKIFQLYFSWSEAINLSLLFLLLSRIFILKRMIKVFFFQTRYKNSKNGLIFSILIFLMVLTSFLVKDQKRVLSIYETSSKQTSSKVTGTNQSEESRPQDPKQPSKPGVLSITVTDQESGEVISNFKKEFPASNQLNNQNHE